MLTRMPDPGRHVSSLELTVFRRTNCPPLQEVYISCPLSRYMLPAVESAGAPEDCRLLPAVESAGTPEDCGLQLAWQACAMVSETSTAALQLDQGTAAAQVWPSSNV